MALINLTVYGKSGKIPNKKKKQLFVDRKQKQIVDIEVGQVWTSSKIANVSALILAVLVKDEHKMISYSYFEFDKLKYHIVHCEKNFRSDFDTKKTPKLSE